MGLTSWLRNRLCKGTGRLRPRPAAPRFRPHLEALEDRWLPSTVTVTTALDVVNPYDSVVSLREAIGGAESGDTIIFDSSLSGQTIKFSAGSKSLEINKDLTIQGLGADQLTISGNGYARVFLVHAGADVTLSGMTITGGNALPTSFIDEWAFSGGGILNLGTLTVDECIATGNTAQDGSGGGIYNAGNMTITHSTISRNDTGAYGAATGIYNAGAMTISNTTISNNLARYAGGIYNRGS